MSLLQYYKKPILSYTSNYAVVLNGFVYGFNSTIFPGIDALRSAFNLSEIDFYINTWDLDENIDWVKVIREESKEYPKVNLKISTLKLEGVRIFDLWEYIYDELGIKYKANELSVEMYTYKRFLPLLVSQIGFNNVFQTIHSFGSIERNTEFPILRIKPTTVFQPPATILKRAVPSLEYDIDTMIKNFSNTAYTDDINPYSVFFTMNASSTSLSDYEWLSTATTYRNIFGSSIEDCANRFITMYQEHLEMYHSKVTTVGELGLFSRQMQFLPLEGSVHLKKYLDMSPVKVNYVGYNNWKAAITRGLMTIKNPWYDIEGRVIRKLNEPEIDPKKSRPGLESVKFLLKPI